MEKLEDIVGKEVFESLPEEVKTKYGEKELIINDGAYIPKAKFDSLNETKKDLENQLKETNEKVQELSKVNPDEMQQKIDELQKKYDEDTKALNDKYDKREYEIKLKDYIKNEKFSSKSSQSSYYEKLLDKNLEFTEDGTLKGYDDFKKDYQEYDPNAFFVEKQEGIRVDTGVDHNDHGDSGKQELKLNPMFRGF